MDNIPTTPNVPNPWIINVPQQEPQAPKAHHDDKLASSGQLAQLLIPQQEHQAQKEKACHDDNLASSAHQLAQLLVPQQESQARKEKACCNATLASSAQQLAQLLGECQNLPCISTKPPEGDDSNIIPQPLLFDWPSNLFNKIKAIISTPCATPTHPEFSFEFTDNGAAHNLEVLRKYNLDLGKVLKAQQDSPLGNRKEFKPPSVLQQVFGLHPLWNRMEAFLSEGSKWPLAEISKNEQQQDLVNALTFGNHKGALQKLVILKKLIAKDLKYGYSLPVPLSSIQLIPGLVMAPINIMEQNTSDEFGQIIPKDRLTHDQSWKWSSGTSVNSRVQKELFKAC
jgi:hypothetical protein